MKNGDPIRIGFDAAASSTSSSTLNLYTPGTNTLYTMLPTDFLYITSLLCNSAGAVDLLAAAAGASAAASSTLLASFNSTGFWEEVGSEALSGPQGVQPSVLATAGAPSTKITGTGFIVRSPGTTRPNFMNSQVPTG